MSTPAAARHALAPLAFVATLLLVPGLGACAAEPEVETEIATDADPAPLGTTAPGAEPSSPPPPSASDEEVTVHLVDHEIHMPSTVPAGLVVFAIENAGESEHAFEVEGQGIEEEVGPLAPGDTGRLEVELAPGTYEVYCPIEDHAEKGMRLELTVTEAGGVAGTAPAEAPRP
jgi:uncharacterized cupredoxin-like copper-binding protein